MDEVRLATTHRGNSTGAITQGIRSSRDCRELVAPPFLNLRRAALPEEESSPAFQVAVVDLELAGIQEVPADELVGASLSLAVGGVCPV
jgi:hypothetical protein